MVHVRNGFAIKVFFIICAIGLVFGMETGKFKTCNQLDFCTRQRGLAPKASMYRVESGSMHLDPGRVSCTLEDIRASSSSSASSKLSSVGAEVTAYEHGIFRLKFQQGSNSDAHEVTDVIVDSAKPLQYKINRVSGAETILSTGSSTATIRSMPFQVEFSNSASKDTSIVINGRELLSLERPLSESEQQQLLGSSEGTVDANKPHKAVGMDTFFKGASHVFGLPERAMDLSLPMTKSYDGSINLEPYRMFNLDVFEYELGNHMGLYGAIPYLMSISKQGHASAILLLNAADSFVDLARISNDDEVYRGSEGIEAHWMSEYGSLDMIYLPGPTPADVLRQLAHMTGHPFMPPQFSVGYHQCRWNYRDETDVAQVDAGFDEYDMPYDVMWLDIEHTNNKQYFTWDPLKFPTPADMQRKLSDKGRKMVTISDPHIKRQSGYHVHEEATKHGYYVKNAQKNEDYEGWCWPGSSSWLDFLNPTVRSFYASLYSYDKYTGSTPSLFTWIDMNEPSVFTGPEITMPKEEAVHYNGRKHGEVHNMYGFYQGMATHQGLYQRSDGQERPFILSRSFFAGSQRYVAVWTGDNAARWDHLAAASPMLLTLAVSGIPFVGADVGGFFGNPDGELFARWYQAGAFYPFFRGHAHLETKRREPWLFGEPYTTAVRNAVAQRYSLLPYWYTAFYRTHVTGLPVIRPLWFEYASDIRTHAIHDQFLIGTDILVKPVTTSNQDKTTVYLPDAENKWFDIESGVQARPSSHSGEVTLDTPLSRGIPVLQRGGSILPRKLRLRRSSTQMMGDPYTLQVALDSRGLATGDLYIDDGHSYDYESPTGYIHRQFVFDGASLRSTAHRALSNSTAAARSSSSSKKKFETEERVERVTIYGFPSKPSGAHLVIQDSSASSSSSFGTASLNAGIRTPLEFDYDSARSVLVIRKPNAPIDSDWVISIE